MKRIFRILNSLPNFETAGQPVPDKYLAQLHAIAADNRSLKAELTDLRHLLSERQERATADPKTQEFFGSQLAPATDQEISSWQDEICGEAPNWQELLLQQKKFSEFYFVDWLTNKSSNIGEELGLAIRCSGTTTEFQKFLFRLYQREFEINYSAEIAGFRERFDNVKLIVMHMSCPSMLHKARASAETFGEEAGIAKNLILHGHPKGPNGRYSFDPDHNVLHVPAADAYEHLAEKMSKAYAFLSFCNLGACVLKIDDDIMCADQGRLISEALPIAEDHHYAGKVWTAMRARCWHFGKCADERLNYSPYGLITDVAYANGPAYLLSPRTVRMLGKASIYLKDFFKVELYEDFAVAKILNHYGIRPFYFDLEEQGILYSARK